MPTSKCLVIDASVLCASGSVALPAAVDDLTPLWCQNVLSTVRTVGYRVITPPLILAEWRGCIPEKLRVRQGKFAAAWLAAMTAKRYFYPLDVPANNQLRRGIEELDVEEGVKLILREDVHLIEAALAVNHIVLSRDVTARRHFHAAAAFIRELRTVVWADPCNTDDDCVNWLKAGARLEKKRRLGFGLY